MPGLPDTDEITSSYPAGIMGAGGRIIINGSIPAKYNENTYAKNS